MTEVEINLLKELDDIAELANKFNYKERINSEDFINKYRTVEEYIALKLMYCYTPRQKCLSHRNSYEEYLQELIYLDLDQEGTLEFTILQHINKVFAYVLCDRLHLLITGGKTCKDEQDIKNIISKYSVNKDLRTELLNKIKNDEIVNAITPYTLPDNTLDEPQLVVDFYSYGRSYAGEICNNLDILIDTLEKDYTDAVKQIEIEKEDKYIEEELTDFFDFAAYCDEHEENISDTITVEDSLYTILTFEEKLLDIKCDIDIKELSALLHTNNLSETLKDYISSIPLVKDFILLIYKCNELIKNIIKNFSQISIPVEDILNLQFWGMVTDNFYDKEYTEELKQDLLKSIDVVNNINTLINYIKGFITHNTNIQDFLEAKDIINTETENKIKERYSALYDYKTYINEYLDFLVECTKQVYPNSILNTCVINLITEGIYTEDLDIKTGVSKLRTIFDKEYFTTRGDDKYCKEELLYSKLGYTKPSLEESALYFRLYPKIFNKFVNYRGKWDTDWILGENEALDNCIIVCCNILKSLTLEELQTQIRKKYIDLRFIHVFTNNYCRIQSSTQTIIDNADSQNWKDTKTRDYIINQFFNKVILYYIKQNREQWEDIKLDSLLNCLTGKSRTGEESITLLNLYLFKDNIHNESLVKIADPLIYQIIMEYELDLL